MRKWRPEQRISLKLALTIVDGKFALPSSERGLLLRRSHHEGFESAHLTRTPHHHYHDVLQNNISNYLKPPIIRDSKAYDHITRCHFIIMLNDNPLTWSSNPWARNSPELNDPNLLKTPPPESKQAWRQRISRYAPDQAWRFVIEHTANPPRQRPSRVAMMAQDSTISTASADLNGLSARQILKRFIRERSCAQEFAERYLDVREKVAIYPGEEIDDDPLLSQGRPLIGHPYQCDEVKSSPSSRDEPILALLLTT